MTREEMLADVVQQVLQVVPCLEVRSWPPGWELKRKLLADAKAALAAPSPAEATVACVHGVAICMECAADDYAGPSPAEATGAQGRCCRCGAPVVVGERRPALLFYCTRCGVRQTPEEAFAAPAAPPPAAPAPSQPEATACLRCKGRGWWEPASDIGSRIKCGACDGTGRAPTDGGGR